MSSKHSIGELRHACEMACEHHAMDFNDLYTLMPGLYFCLKKKEICHIVPSDFIDQIAAHKSPVFQSINKYLKVMLEFCERREKEKAEEEGLN